MTTNLSTSPISNAARAPPPEPTAELRHAIKTTTIDGISNYSPLQRARLLYTPRVNPILRNASTISFSKGPETTAAFDEEAIHALFPNLYGQPSLFIEQALEPNKSTPKNVAVVLSGGPASGGHNVICGLYDFVTEHHPDSKLFGFLSGPDGIIKNEYVVLDKQAVDPFRNQGGFHIIGSGRTKIETDEQFAAARKTVQDLKLDSLLIVGGDDSNSNAMKLAENFRAHGLQCGVNGAPKTIDNDLRNDQIEVSFGFDSASKSYSQAIANLALDAVSARKAYHFVRVMGRSASHIALECALQTHPNLCFISEEVKRNGVTLLSVVEDIADLICERADMGKNYGLIVVPEGLVEFMPDVESLINEVNELLNGGYKPIDREQCISALTRRNSLLFEMLPESIANQLLLERDPHGNVQVAKIEIERLLIYLVSADLAQRKKAGEYSGKFNAVPHYLGYEARCVLPTNFDANYTYGLGRVAGALCCNHHSGYIATLSNLTKQPEEWVPAGYPLTMMMNIERRHGKDVAVIKKMLVDLDGAAFTAYYRSRKSWKMSDNYRSPGGPQFWGPVADDVTISLELDNAAKTK